MKTVVSVVTLILTVIAMWLAIIIAATPGPRIIDCSMASFHPDYTAEMRKACNTRFIKQ